MITQLDNETADLDLTSFVLALTKTPNGSFPMQCQGLVYIGDGSKDLDGTGGTFKIKMIFGAQETHEISFTVTAGDTRVALWTPPFPVQENKQVQIYLLSPNGADTDVNVDAFLYDCSPISYTPAELAGVAATLEEMINAIWRDAYKKATQTATQKKHYKNDNSTVIATQALSDDQTTQTQGAAS